MTLSCTPRRATIRWCALVLALLGAALPGLSVSGHGASAAGESAGEECLDVAFLGARGSGQPFLAAELGMGSVVHDAYRVFRDSLEGKTFGEQGIRFPALSTDYIVEGQRAKYFQGLDTGVTKTLSLIRSYAAACPHQHFVLSGYSQGAMVMHRVVWELAESDFDLSRIDGVVAIGDGDRLPGKGETQYGTAKDGRGIAFRFPKLSGDTYRASTSTLPSSLGSRFRSVCLDHDLICDPNLMHLTGAGTGAWIGVKNHEKYVQGRAGFPYVKRAVKAVAAHSSAVVVEPDDGPPHILSTSLPDAVVGDPYFAVLATDDDRPGTWSVSGAPGWLSVDPETGTMSGTPALPKGTVTLDVSFIDRQSRTTAKDLSLNVTGFAPDALTAEALAAPMPEGARTEGQSSPAGVLDCAPSTASRYCVSYGSYQRADGSGGSYLVEDYDGALTTRAVPPADDGGAVVITGGSCSAAWWCLLRGMHGTTPGVGAVVRLKDGLTSTYLPEVDSPTDSVDYLDLRAVSCWAEDACGLVGLYKVTGSARTRAVVGSWTGDSITIEEAALPADAGAWSSSELDAVTCRASGVCTALGSYVLGDGSSRVLAARSSLADGWSFAAAPAPAAAVGAVSLAGEAGIDCPSDDVCYAATPYNGGGIGRVAVETYDHGTWSVTDLPPLQPDFLAGPANQQLASLSCPSVNECYVATREIDATSGSWTHLASVIHHLDHGTWSTSTPPTYAGAPSAEPNGRLEGVTCTAHASCIGYGEQRGHAFVYLVGVDAEAQLVTPPPNASYSYLSSVSCSSLTACMGAGWYDDTMTRSSPGMLVRLTLEDSPSAS